MADRPEDARFQSIAGPVLKKIGSGDKIEDRYRRSFLFFFPPLFSRRAFGVLVAPLFLNVPNWISRSLLSSYPLIFQASNRKGIAITLMQCLVVLQADLTIAKSWLRRQKISSLPVPVDTNYDRTDQCKLVRRINLIGFLNE